MSFPVPSFHTKRLILRPILLSDAKLYEENFVDYEVISQLSAVVPWPYPEGGVENYLKEFILPNQGNGHWAWGIFLKESPEQFIGSVDLWREGKPENRGFWLGRNYWGKGYMTEAVEPVMDYAFQELGFEKLVFTNARGNTRSRRVKEKTGARLLRVEPAKFVSPDYKEQEIWELTRDEWCARKCE